MNVKTITNENYIELLEKENKKLQEKVAELESELEETKSELELVKGYSFW